MGRREVWKLAAQSGQFRVEAAWSVDRVAVLARQRLSRLFGPPCCYKACQFYPMPLHRQGNGGNGRRNFGRRNPFAEKRIRLPCSRQLSDGSLHCPTGRPAAAEKKRTWNAHFRHLAYKNCGQPVLEPPSARTTDVPAATGPERHRRNRAARMTRPAPSLTRTGHKQSARRVRAACWLSGRSG